MRIEGDFTKVSSNTEKLEPGQYRFRVTKAEPGEAQAGKQTPFIIESEVVGGTREGTPYQDWIYTQTKDGKPNKMGLGRIKAYAEAILGEEAANSPTGYDSDDFISGTFDGVITHESYADKSTEPPTQKIAARLTRILKAQ
jgi:hypothetical protein